MTNRETLGHFVFATSAILSTLFFSSAAIAQETPLCPGPEARAQWAGGNESNSDISIIEMPIDFDSDLPQGSRKIEYLIFDVSSATSVRLEAFANGNGDPAIELRDERGNIIAEDDDGGGGWESRAEVSLNPGRYCLSAFSVDDEDISMQLRIGRAEHDALTAGGGGSQYSEITICVPETPATDLSEGAIDELLDGSITSTASVSQIPFYRFSIAEPQRLSISANGESADPVLKLFDFDGLLLAENDDYGSGYNARIDIAEPLEPGIYCIGVGALDDDDIPIRLALNIYDANAALRQRYDQAEATPPLDGSYPMTELEFLSGSAQAEMVLTTKAAWYRFDVTEPSIIFVEALGDLNTDPTATIFDSLGRVIAYNDDALHDTYDSLVAARLEPGTYLIAINQVESDSEPHIVRLLVEQYAREKVGSSFWSGIKEKLF